MAQKALIREADKMKDSISVYIDDLIAQIEDLTEQVKDLERDLEAAHDTISNLQHD